MEADHELLGEAGGFHHEAKPRGRDVLQHRRSLPVAALHGSEHAEVAAAGGKLLAAQEAGSDEKCLLDLAEE